MFRFIISALHEAGIGSVDRLPGWSLPVTGHVTDTVSDTDGDSWFYVLLDSPIEYTTPFGVGAGTGPSSVAITDVLLRPHFLDEDISPGMQAFPMDFAVVLDPSMRDSRVVDLNRVDFIAVVEVDDGGPIESVEASPPLGIASAEIPESAEADQSVAQSEAVENAEVEAAAEAVEQQPVITELPESAGVSEDVESTDLQGRTQEEPEQTDTVESDSAVEQQGEWGISRPAAAEAVPDLGLGAVFDPGLHARAELTRPAEAADVSPASPSTAEPDEEEAAGATVWTETGIQPSPQPPAPVEQPKFIPQVQLSPAAKSPAAAAAGSWEFPGPVEDRPGRGSANLKAAAAAAAAVAVGGVVLFMMTTRDSADDFADSQPVSTTQESSTAASSRTPSPPRAEDIEKMTRLLPPGYRADSCFPAATTGRGGLVTMTCGRNADADGPPSGLYTLFPDQTRLSAAFNTAVAESDRLICPGDMQSPGPWRRNADPNKPVGTLFCGTRGQDPVVIWSDNERLTLNIVRSSPNGGPGLDALYTWWTQHS